MNESPSRGRLRPLLSGVVLRSQTDQRLCALAGAGNQQAFNAIFERYRRELGSHAARIVRADRADDVVQQAMLGAWTALVSGSPISDLRPWLHRIVHNAALDTISRRGYDDGELPDSSISPALTEELVERRLAAGAALTAMAALPENQLRALTLTAIEGRTGHDAALAMGISDTAMRQLVFRARSRVRAAASALTPLPLVSWLVGTGASATPAAVGLAGGGAATAAKVIAVIGVTATLGVTHTLQSGGGPPRHRAAPTRHAAAINAGARLAVQQVALATPASRTRVPPPRLADPATHSTGAPPASRSPTAPPADGAAGDPGGHQPGRSTSHDSTDAASDNGSANQSTGQGSAPGGRISPDAPAATQPANDQPADGPAEAQQGSATSSGRSGRDGASPPTKTSSDNVATGATGATGVNGDLAREAAHQGG